jgi:hypothetical protein
VINDSADSIERVQAGVLTTSQAIARFGRTALRRNINAGRWVSAGRRVVVLHNGPLSTEQRLWLVLMSSPHGSVLGSWSALAFDGLRVGHPIPAHVVIPDGARRPTFDDALAGVRVTRSDLLGDQDVVRDRPPARTRTARSLIDAAILASNDAQARLALIQGIQAGITSTRALRRALDRRGQRRRLGVLRETLDDLDGGVRSRPEREFGGIVRRFGLPSPDRQAVAVGVDGRYYLDADWPARGVSAEVHGVHHARVRQLERDRRRHNAITVQQGRRVLHFSSNEIRHEPDAVAAALSAPVDLRLGSVEIRAVGGPRPSA